MKIKIKSCSKTTGGGRLRRPRFPFKSRTWRTNLQKTVSGVGV